MATVFLSELDGKIHQTKSELQNKCIIIHQDNTLAHRDALTMGKLGDELLAC